MCEAYGVLGEIRDMYKQVEASKEASSLTVEVAPMYRKECQSRRARIHHCAILHRVVTGVIRGPAFMRPPSTHNIPRTIHFSGMI